jgi:hypothetical protein
MIQVVNNAIHLKDWVVISVKGGIVLKYEAQDQVRLIEIARNNNTRTLSIDADPNPDFCERDAWLIARVIVSMLESSGEDYWEGASPLLPVSFDGFSVENLRALAALVYCYHTPQPTMLCSDDEQGRLHHVRFDGNCWMVSITKELELELDFILKV